MQTVTVATPGSSQVVVKMLAAPISEYDVAVVSGRAGPFSGTAGNEGVGVVTGIGSGVKGISVNDWVVPSAPGLGTFAEVVVVDAAHVQAVPKSLGLTEAALLGTASTALRLLSDFGGATKVVVQNAANSAVGQAVVQIAKSRGIKTINIIPDGPEDGAVVEHLYALGADIVVTESYAASAKFAELVADLPAPALGINGAGGAAATAVVRAVADGATVVTYGGSAAVTVPTSALVGKGITVRGFSLARWNAGASQTERAALTRAAVDLVNSGALRSTVKETPFADFFAALKGFEGRSSQAVQTTVLKM
jgi:trans-2-enoyl-CoA reductase